MLIKLKDSEVEFQAGITVAEIAKSISEGLARNAICARVNDEIVDMSTTITTDSTIEILTYSSDDGKKVFKHSAAHVLAQAVKRIYPTAKFAIGPAIANGFYYDFDFKTPVTSEDIPKIEEEIKKIVKENLPFIREEVSYKDALALFKSMNETYKLELIQELGEAQTITIYRQGDYVDLCRGAHIPSTGMLKAIKLTSITGAYWRGDERNKMLTRIYGAAFEKKADLEEYLAALEQARLRDHNKIGRDLGYFMTDENIGQGLPLLAPKGAKLFQILTRFVEDEEERRGYVLTKTPFMAKSSLYKCSGHWEHYKDKMFIIGDESNEEELLALRPMTCPFQFTIYNNGLKSYRDLPVRYGETSTLFRKEASGEMHGLIRIRQFTLSEGHIVCTPDQVEQEFRNTLDLIYFMLSSLGLREDVSFRFSKWDPEHTDKYINNPRAWEETQAAMKIILDHLNLDYVEAIGEAAFYGPKLDIQIKNVHGKEDTLITVQIDFNLAERFNMTYVDKDGNKERPIIIHRTSIGCYERTMALLIEKYGAAFPLWFSPVQVKVMSLTDRTAEDAITVQAELRKVGIRAELDTRSEKIGYKIREAQLEKTPYMIIIGDKEKEANVVAVRSRKAGDLGIMPLAKIIEILLEEIKTRSLI